MSVDEAGTTGLPWKWIAGGIVVLALAAAWYFLPVEEWAAAFDQWIQQLGVWGGVVFAAVYVLATVLVMPAWPLTVVAGLAYGVAIGFPLVLVSATVGATLAFLVARYLLRQQVEKKLGERNLFRAVDRAISDKGWRVVGLLRLSPVVPFNLQNYLYGITGIRFWHYVAATFIGMMPGTLMYVYFGAAGMAAVGGGSESGEGDTLKWSFFAAGLVATIVVAVIVTRRARQELDKIIDEDSGSNEAPRS
ncbi:MAG: TVP38/TMEM64 family protein [Gammaproteobacteria bacterium]|nr:TVP38/TMEM64 family protein [Gammaproteobacteria bacterium]